MNRDAQRLMSILVEQKDQLWMLQNYALQLTVDGQDRDVCTALADGLEELRNRVSDVLPLTVGDRLAMEILELRSGQISQGRAQQVFTLVEALVSAADGDDSRLLRLSQQVDESGETQDEMPQSSGADLPAGLVDDLDETDPEDMELFSAEAKEHLQSMELHLLELEKTKDLELVQEIFRGIHSIKGGAQYLGLEATATLSHRIETLLDRIRSGAMTLNQVILSGLLRGVDVLTELVDAVSQGVATDTDVGKMVGEIETLLNATEAAGGGEEEPASPSSQELEQDSGDVDDEDVEASELASLAERHEPDAAELGDEELFEVEFLENLESAKALFAELQALMVDPSALAVATRNLHSMKGLAGLVELTSIESVATVMDRLVAKAARHRHELPPDIERAVQQGLALLTEVFNEYRDQGHIETDVNEYVRSIADLADREDRVAQWDQTDPWQAFASEGSEGPLTGSFSDLIEALKSNDLSSAESALEALGHDADLQGYDEVSAEARTLLTALNELGQDDLIDRVGRLRELLPGDDLGWKPAAADSNQSFEDIALGIPGIGKKKLDRLIEAGIVSVETVMESSTADIATIQGINIDQARMLVERCSRNLTAAGSRLGDDDVAALDRLVLQESYDLELVDIYLNTTGRQIDAAKAMLREENTEQALELLEDLVGAAGYMAYEPLVTWFGAASELLSSDPPEHAECNTLLSEVRREIERLRLSHAQVGGEQASGDSDFEVGELERIFVESAETHLRHLADDVVAFFAEMNEELLGAIQHHASCIHSGATNIGRDRAVVAAEGLVDVIEGMWLNPERLDRDSCLFALSQLKSLFESCGAPAPEFGDVELAQSDASSAKALVTPDESSETHHEVSESDLETAFDALVGEELPGTPVTGTELEVSGLESESSADAPKLLDSVVDDGSPIDHPESASVREDESEEPASISRGLVGAQSTVRVDTAKIDDLMNMMAELVVNRSSFMVLSNTVNDLMTRLIDDEMIGTAEAREVRTVLTRYDEAMNDLGRVSNQLQQGVMRIRMMPIRTLFSRIPRLVRELGIRENRSVAVSFSGEETELDKKVLERLSDPIIHLIRNAIGHGIESPEERRVAGKPEGGQLHISAHHQGNIVVIEIQDDGRGIDYQKVEKRLVESAKAQPSQDSGWTQRDLEAAIFLPGFSTSRNVTDVSGRGVGLDVVKRNVEELGGQVDVSSDPGRSCKFTIRIPLTMAIMQALLVRVGDETYAIPVSSVIEAEFVNRDDIYSVENKQVITVRDTVIPLIELEEVFAYNYYLEKSAQGGSDALGSGAEASDSVYVVVLQGDGREVGMVVNELVGTQDIVIKSLEDELVDARGIAGASILGDGTVTLILDVGELQRMVIDGHSDDLQRSQTLRRLERLIRDRGHLGIDIVN